MENNNALFEHFSFTVDNGQSPLRIDKYLMNFVENATRTKIQAAAKNGSIQVNGVIVKSNYKVKPEDQIKVLFEYPPSENELIAENIKIDIVFEDDDLILSSDLDEIPNPEILEAVDEWVSDDTHFTFQQKRYVYFINNFETDVWFGTRACTGKYLKNTSIDQIRENTEREEQLTGSIITNGGWHFTFCGGEEMVKTKIESFSHTEHNTPQVLSSISNRIKGNKDPLLRDWYQYYKVDIDDSFPAYIVENQDKLSKWIKND